MKIISLQAENVKRLTAVEIRPDGNVVQITGANANGKSSVLDALYWAFAGKSAVQRDPIRTGQERARIVVDTGELVVHRTFSRKGDNEFTTSLRVENADGSKRTSPQELLDKLVGTLSLDPMSFMALSPKEKFDVAKQFVSGVDFEAIAAANKEDYDARTEVRRKIKALKANADAIAVPDDLPEQPIDEAALLERMASAAERNSNIEKERMRRQSATKDANAALATAEACRKKAAELLAQAEASEKTAAEIAHELATLPALEDPTEVSYVRSQIDAARKVNEQIKLRDERDRILREIAREEFTDEAYTEAMADREKAKQEAIAAAKMPVPGLDFGDGEVLLNGHPIDQASGAEQIRASIAIAMAMNPTLRVIRVRDGNALDENGMRLLAEMAEEHDCQVWVERVDTSGAVGFVIEDGTLKSSHVEEAA